MNVEGTTYFEIFQSIVRITTAVRKCKYITLPPYSNAGLPIPLTSTKILRTFACKNM